MDKELKRALADMTEGTDPERVEEAVRERIAKGEVPSEVRRHPGRCRKPIRAVLAAAVVLILTLSGYAAVQKMLTVTLPEEGPYDVVLQVPEDMGDMIVLPEEKRKELQAHVITQEDIKNGIYAEKEMRFDTWTEAAAWLDCGILTSDLLTAADQIEPWRGVRLRVNGEISPDLGSHTSISVTGTVESPLLDRNGLHGAYGFLTVTIPLSGKWENYGHTMIYQTDRIYAEGEAAAVDLNEHEKQSTGELVTRYTTTSGIPVEIAVLTVPYAQTVYPDGKTAETEMRDSTQVHLFFLHEGILYTFQFSTTDAETGTETAKAIAESMR